MKLTRFSKLYLVTATVLLGSFLTLGAGGYRLLSAYRSFGFKQTVYIPGSTLQHK